jgi:hypothetical protein
MNWLPGLIALLIALWLISEITNNKGGTSL